MNWNVCTSRMGDDLERLTETSSLVCRERKLVVLAVVLNGSFSLPNITADLNDLSGSTNGSVVWHAVKAFYYLRPRCAKAKDCSTLGKVINACCSHSQQRGSTRVDRQDARRDLNARGLGCQVAHQADSVVAVGFCHIRDVHANGLKGLHLSY